MSYQFSGGATTMEVNGLTCTLHMPAALKSQRGSDGKEISHSLPPRAPRAAFRVAEYDEACPESWIRGSAEEASYFVPVQAEHGLWLDFNGCANDSHDIAVLISVQGVNPITGRPVGDDKLEQYRKNCPVHNKPFGEERFCKICKFKWEPQNYLAGNATPWGYLWLDGFRTETGEVRQWVFTEEMERGIAAQILGAERVFAIGIAFYRSKKPKPVRESYRSAAPLMLGSDHSYPASGYRRARYSLRSSRAFGSSSEPIIGASISHNAASSARSLELAAGAKIIQRIHQDPEELDYWQNEPAGRLYINYCSVEVAREILATGKKDLTAGGEGFMQGLKVGQK